MHHLFADISQLSDNGKTLRITGDDFHHIAHVLRMKEGEELSVSLKDEADTAGEHTEYRFGIDRITDEEIVCALRFVKRSAAELPVRLVLLQGLPKGDKMEQIIEKNTELGVTEIVPVSLKRSVVKLDEKKAAARVVRWNRIAEAAAKQARRGIVPKVADVMPLAEALSRIREADVKLLPYELEPAEEEAQPGKASAPDGSCGMERTRRLIEQIAPGQTVAVFIGPEGGFEESEVRIAREAGFETVTLGGRILRTETAGMAVTAWIAYRF